MTWVRDLSIRAKVAVTILGALAVSLGLATMFSIRYWEREQYALTTSHALMVAGMAQGTVEAALAHGQVGLVRTELDRLTHTPPVEAYRVVARDGTVLMSSRRAEERRRRPGPPLPDVWDIPSEGQSVGKPGSPELGVVVPLSGAAGPGSRVLLELIVGGGKIEQAIERARTFGVALTVAVGLAYAVLLGAMMEREIIGPFRRLERLAATQQEQLNESAGFAEVGALASEVAHEIKRPLAGIKGAIELIEQEYAMSDEERRLLAQVEGELSHVDETLRDLLSLARPVGLERRPVVLHDVIDGALARLAGTPGMERVTVERRYDRSLPPIPGDAQRLEQAILNLCANAFEAMPAGGRLVVATRAREGLVEIVVSDTGVGIPRENLARITKPFFSTKPRGTGLGLPLVARVLAAHGGRMAVESEAGRGTTIRLELPVRNHQWPANAS